MVFEKHYLWFAQCLQSRPLFKMSLTTSSMSKFESQMQKTVVKLDIQEEEKHKKNRI